MRRLTLFICTVFVLAVEGCDPVLIGEMTSDGTISNRNHGNADDETTTQNGDYPDSEGTGRMVLNPKTLYVTGVEYPEGVDWQGDIGYDIEGSKLFLMKDGDKIIELSVGYDECVAIDADMHRCIDGHLYTDFSTDDETVVKVDGVEAYRYAGREMIKSMCVHENRIYTLSVPRDGTAGWKYRRDGEEIYSQTDGEFVGGLYEDDGDIVFTYMVENTDTHYLFVNNVLTTITFPSNPAKVLDVRRIGGKINYISAKDNVVTAMEGDSLLSVIGDLSEIYEPEMKIYYDGEDRFFVGTTGSVSGVWQEEDISVKSVGPPVGFHLRGNSYICVIKNESDEPVSIYYDGNAHPWQDWAELMYDTCIATDGISHTVGLIDKSRDYAPALWKDETVTNYDFNGFLTHVDYW